MEFLNVEISEKIFKRLIVISLVILIAFLAFTMSSLLIFKSYTLGPNTSVNYEKLNMHIDLLETSSKKVEISGWAYKEDEPIVNVNCNYVLKHKESEKMYLMRTKMEDNINIEDENLKKAGMHAQCLTIGIPKGWYDIYVLYRNGEEDILANTLISVEVK